MSLPFTLKFRLVSHNDNLKNAPAILANEFKKGLESIGKRLTSSAETRMRKDSGDERRSLQTVIEGKGLGINVVVYSVLLKAFIDAYGMRPGVRVPYGFGSRLHTWAQRRVRLGSNSLPKSSSTAYDGAGPRRVFQPKTKVTQVRGTAKPRLGRVTKSGTKVKGSARIANKNKQASRLAFLVARTIFDRGIKGTNWNRKALEANKGRIIRELKNSLSRAAVRINRG